MKNILGILRLFAFIFLLLFFLIRLSLVRIFSKNPTHSFHLMKKWAKSTIALLGIQPEYRGKAPQEGVLFLPNHRSYIDIVFFPVHAAVSFLSKAEVKKWPLIGWGARAVQTVFVDRSSKESRKLTKTQIRSRLIDGNSVVVFPEGTTSNGPGLLPLNPGMFYVAAEEKLTVVPVAIEYKDIGDGWEGKEPFLRHFIRCFSKRRTYVVVTFGEMVKGNSGQELQEEVQRWLLETLDKGFIPPRGHSLFPSSSLALLLAPLPPGT